MACLAIVVTIIIIILIQRNSYGGNDGDTNKPKTAEEERTIKEEKDNVTRKDDIARFMTAATDFQYNNNGKTPWNTGETNSQFVKRYIDARCTAKAAYAPDDECGDEFRDPDGKPYYFVYEGTLENERTVNFSKDHGVYVYTKAECGDEGAVKPMDGIRQYAMLYKLSDGSVYCIDNH